MQTIFRLLLLLTMFVFTFGCAQNYYNVPKETFEKKVRTLGVAPIFVDAESDIRHPEKDALVALVTENNRKNEKELIAKLKDTGTYFSVRLLDEDASQLFSSVFARREKRDDAGVKYNKYFFKPEELRNLISKNGVDAIMFVTINGLSRPEKVYSSNLLSYLDSEYNYLAVSAQIIDADGNTLWEFPNFRQRVINYPMFLALQYPDFDEAAANLNERVDVKFKTIPGIARALTKKESSVLGKRQVPTLYNNIFDEMVSLQRPDRNLFGGKKPAATDPAKSGEQK